MRSIMRAVTAMVAAVVAATDAAIVAAMMVSFAFNSTLVKMLEEILGTCRVSLSSVKSGSVSPKIKIESCGGVPWACDRTIDPETLNCSL